MDKRLEQALEHASYVQTFPPKKNTTTKSQKNAPVIMQAAISHAIDRIDYIYKS